MDGAMSYLQPSLNGQPPSFRMQGFKRLMRAISSHSISRMKWLLVFAPSFERVAVLRHNSCRSTRLGSRESLHRFLFLNRPASSSLAPSQLARTHCTCAADSGRESTSRGDLVHIEGQLLQAWQDSSRALLISGLFHRLMHNSRIKATHPYSHSAFYLKSGRYFGKRGGSVCGLKSMDAAHWIEASFRG
jgi:hypothetical protein